MKKYIIPVSESIDLKLEGTIAISETHDEYLEDNTGWHSQKAEGPWSSDVWDNTESEE